MKLRGICPVQITMKRLEELHVEFESKDIGVYTVIDNADEIQDCHNPYDSFALHKAALIVCQLDSGTTNTCIDQILLVCEELIDGKFISGAGGGGFIQVILKKGVTREKLHDHLRRVFQDSGVDVWDCELMI